MPRLGESPLIRLTGLRAGRHRYIEGDLVQLVEITYEGGDAYATFLDAEDEDEGVMVPVSGMAGRFERVVTPQK